MICLTVSYSPTMEPTDLRAEAGIARANAESFRREVERMETLAHLLDDMAKLKEVSGAS